MDISRNIQFSLTHEREKLCQTRSGDFKHHNFTRNEEKGILKRLE